MVKRTNSHKATEAPSRLDKSLPFILCVSVALWSIFLHGSTGSPPRPDVAVLLTDQQHGGALGAAGNRVISTPAMDALAREGVLFQSAFCATPQCSPSRAALLTGRFPHRTGVMGNVEPRGGAGLSAPLSADIPGLAKIFADAGYETAYFGKWHLGDSPSKHGFQTAMVDAGKPLGQALAFLKARSGVPGTRRPLFLFISWLSPHEIYSINDPRLPEARLVPATPLMIPLPGNLRDDLRQKPFPQLHFLTEDQGKPFQNYGATDWQRYRTFYNSLVASVDREIGDVVDVVRRNNPNSLIFFSSDHGDLGGAHGLPFKGPAMYEELVRVPFIFSWPGKFRPGIRRELASNIDLLPTFCDLLRLPLPDGVDGLSLAPLLTGQKKQLSRDAIFGEYYGKQNWRVPIRMVRTKDWKYVRYVKYGEELYNLQTDPGELQNLATDPGSQQQLKALASRLDGWITRTNDPFPKLTATDRSGRVLE